MLANKPTVAKPDDRLSARLRSVDGRSPALPGMQARACAPPISTPMTMAFGSSVATATSISSPSSRTEKGGDPASAERVTYRRTPTSKENRNMPISLKNSDSILPYVRYSPQSNAMTVAGEDNKPREISFLGKSFAIDIENGSMGWLLDRRRRRATGSLFRSTVSRRPRLARTISAGFSILLYAPKLLGSPEAHEMCCSTGAHLSFCERLYNEAEPHFGKGDVPIVKITEAEPIKVGKGKSRELKFEIVKWVPRPAAIIEALAKLKAANAPPNKRCGHERRCKPIRRRRFR